jgi:hypothetical protein
MFQTYLNFYKQEVKMDGNEIIIGKELHGYKITKYLGISINLSRDRKIFNCLQGRKPKRSKISCFENRQGKPIIYQNIYESMEKKQRDKCLQEVDLLKVICYLI